MGSNFLRQAGPNEKRCIIRHELGYYSNVAIGTVYQIQQGLVQAAQVESLSTYLPALRACVDEHPFLSAVVQGSSTENPSYARANKIDLGNHFRVVTDYTQATNLNSREKVLIENALSTALNPRENAFRNLDLVPAWQLHLARLPDRDQYHRVFLCFVFAHSHSDGVGALAFHSTLFRALRESIGQNDNTVNHEFIPAIARLPDQPDPASKLHISLPYLLLPLIGHYLPRFITRLFGLSGTATGVDGDTWSATPMFTDERTPNQVVTTAVEYLSIEPEILKGALATCRNHGAKLTALLHELMARAMSKALLAEGVQLPEQAHFISATAMNLRPALGVSNEVMGIYASAAYARHEVYRMSGTSAQDITDDESLWTAARKHTKHFSTTAAELKNQPIGLLRYVSNYRSWMTSKIGHTREGSWNLSNLLGVKQAIHDTSHEGKPVVAIEKMVFAQPASVAGTPIEYNVISVADGPLSICITWQIGAIGIVNKDAADAEAREKRFMRSVTDSLREQFEGLAKS